MGFCCKPCKTTGRFHGVYTGNQVGCLNFTGCFNFVSGGGPENGITAGCVVMVFIPPIEGERRPWRLGNARMGQPLLDSTYPEIEFNFIADITLKDGTLFRVSDKNIYVEDEDEVPRYYEARANAPTSVIKTLGEWLNPRFEIGETILELSNFDGIFDDYLPNGELYQNWTNSEVKIRIGFGEKAENYMILYQGYVAAEKGLEIDDGVIKLRVREQYERDQVEIPRRTYNAELFPFISEAETGDRIPIVYGDWTLELDQSKGGQVRARCINGDQIDPDTYVFKVCDNALREISDIFIERGEHLETDQDEEGNIVSSGSRNPVPIDLNEIILDLNDGQFQIPVDADVLTEDFVIIESGFAGPGSGLNKVSFTTDNFNDLGVQVNDTVVNLVTGDRGVVTQVQDFTLDLAGPGGSGDLTINENDEFRIISRKYVFRDGDILTVRCKGKPIQITDYLRLQDPIPGLDEPSALSVTTDGHFWVADNTTQKIYKIKFQDNEVVEEIDYSSVDAGLTDCRGLSIDPSRTRIWVIGRNQGIIYRYDVAMSATDVTIETDDIVGIPSTLTEMSGVGLTVLNHLYIADDDTAAIYEIDPFNAPDPALISSFSYASVDAGLLSVSNLDYDVYNDRLGILDSAQEKLILAEANGTFIQDFVYDDMYLDIRDPSAVSFAQDASVFFIDRKNDVLYNFLPFDDVHDNPGFQVKDLIQGFSNRTFDDFSINWNVISDTQLSQFKSRFIIGTRKSQELISFANEVLDNFNTELFIDETKFNIFYNDFVNYTTEGFLVAERDIILNTFNPKKEQRQYFNSADSLYRFLPKSNRSKRSETYFSLEGIDFSRIEKHRTFKLQNAYRESDITKILSTRINQSVPEPEIIDVRLGFRCMRLQPADFLNILYADGTGGFCPWDQTQSQRRFVNIPSYIREIKYDLRNMTMRMKIWSLGTTEFTGFTPADNPPGGQFGKILVNALGNPGVIAPVGTILSQPALNEVQVADVDGQDAESRDDPEVGLAWTIGYSLALVDGTTHEILETNKIQSVSGQVITFENDWVNSISATTFNNSGTIDGGNYITYANYDIITDTTTEDLMKDRYVWVSRPINAYPPLLSQFLEELTSGAYNFDDGRNPYSIGRD